MNASGTGTTCTLTTAPRDPSAETTEWTVYDYNPSGQAIAPRNSPNSMPAMTPDGGMTWTFQFLPNTYTALFTTTDPNMTGDLSMKMLSDTISVSRDALSFMTQNGGGDCTHNVPAAVRFFFRSSSASGPSTGTPPAGFYTRFWWSNPMNMVLASANQSGFITASMSDPNEWSDWNGQRRDSSPAVMESFFEATHKVQAIGLSFGGECFFETPSLPRAPLLWSSSPASLVSTEVHQSTQCGVGIALSATAAPEHQTSFMDVVRNCHRGDGTTPMVSRLLSRTDLLFRFDFPRDNG